MLHHTPANPLVAHRCRHGYLAIHGAAAHAQAGHPAAPPVHRRNRSNGRAPFPRQTPGHRALQWTPAPPRRRPPPRGAARWTGPGCRRAEELEEAVWRLRAEKDAAERAAAALRAELDAERGAAGTAASETMLMITRLQLEKAAAMMEAREFRDLAEGRNQLAFLCNHLGKKHILHLQPAPRPARRRRSSSARFYSCRDPKAIVRSKSAGLHRATKCL
ncbi:hypothetical protein PVAP13_2NG045900 [Panicum virgatum]|uniref:GTD-binding domain-containing protein n=1 Tax=Panicum virgatum TaxID=38727 RepID=A0A8T0VJ66_PANVG|nr:hypothetical protein PVAP13_2NG045900 [Panicum virgatum]